MLNKNTFKEIDSQDKCLVMFSADWCGPCKMMYSVIEELSKEYTVYKVDADEEADLAKTLGIKNLPTFLFYKNGVEYARKVGVLKKEFFVSELKR
ncbi:MAG: thioredoxin family protein [Chitinophagales bacterium]|nr:thioredoxin family protein [Chitinophagales bacterium]